MAGKIEASGQRHSVGLFEGVVCEDSGLAFWHGHTASIHSCWIGCDPAVIELTQEDVALFALDASHFAPRMT